MESSLRTHLLERGAEGMWVSAMSTPEGFACFDLFRSEIAGDWDCYMRQTHPDWDSSFTQPNTTL